MAAAHIYRGTNRRFHVVVRLPRAKNYRHVSTHLSKRAAAQRLADEMASGRGYKRGAVTFTSDYYDPVAVLEMVRP